MSSATREAYRFRAEKKITLLSIDYEFMLQFLKSCDFTVKTYSQARADPAFYFLEKYAEQSKGFTCIQGNNASIYIKDELPLEEKVKVLAHELGHIVLRHSYHGVLDACEDEEKRNFLEDEANEFALIFIAPPCLLKHLGLHLKSDIQTATLLGNKDAEEVYNKVKRYTCLYPMFEKEIIRLYREATMMDDTNKGGMSIKQKRLIVASFFVLIFCLVLLVAINLFINRKIEYNNKALNEKSLEIILPISIFMTPVTEEIEKAAQQQDENLTIYITSSGKKYHLKDCQYISNKKNIIHMPLNEAKKIGMRPCKICNPGMEKD